MAVTYAFAIRNRKDQVSKKKLLLRITYQRKRRYFNVEVDNQIVYLTNEEYDQLGKSRSKRLRNISKRITQMTDRVEDILSVLSPFNFEEFERLLYRKNRLSDAFKDKINELRAQNKLKSAEGYETCMKAFLKFDDPLVSDIDKNWINKFIQHRKTYPKFYLIGLRHICNRSQNDVFQHVKIKTKTKTKIPLSPESLKAFMNYTSPFRVRRMHHAFWMMSYYGGGMNTKDWFFLRPEEVKERFIIKDRRKSDVALIVPITRSLDKLMKEYATAGDYYFGLIDDNMTLEEKENKYTNFLGNLRRSLRAIRKELDIPEKITPYIARHTHANTLLNKGVSLENIKDSLGQLDIKSTQVYARSLSTQNKFKIARLLEEE